MATFMQHCEQTNITRITAADVNAARSRIAAQVENYLVTGIAGHFQR